MTKALSVTELRRGTSALVNRVHATGEAVVITHRGRAKAILQGSREWEETRRTVAMLMLLARSEDDVARGATEPHERVARRARKRASKSRP